jgi:RNA polymerase sigma factor (TIGR02999 family)
MAPEPSDVTRLLAAVGTGNAGAVDALFRAVYHELRAMARAQMARERPGGTLQPTALVHEAFLRLAGSGEVGWENRRHFFGAAAEAMRRILVERARSRARLKRGSGRAPVTLDDLAQEGPAADDLLAVDEALGRLERRDAAMAEVVKLRWFAGLTVEETASALGVSPRSVERLWTSARAWLHREIASPPGPRT